MIMMSIVICSMGAIMAQSEYVKGDTITFKDGRFGSGVLFFMPTINNGDMIELKKTLRSGTSGYNLFVSFDKALIKNQNFYAILMVEKDTVIVDDTIKTDTTILSKVKAKLIYSSWKKFNSIHDYDAEDFTGKVDSKEVEKLTKSINTYKLLFDKGDVVDIKDWHINYNGNNIQEIRIIFPEKWFDYVLYYQVPKIYNPEVKSKQELKWEKEEEGLNDDEIWLLRRKRYEEEKAKREKEKKLKHK